MSVKTRLKKLESRLIDVLATVVAFSIDGVFNEEQQARLDQAKNEGRPFQVIEYEIVK